MWLPWELVELILDYCDIDTQCDAARFLPYRIKSPIAIDSTTVRRLEGMVVANDVVANISAEALLPYSNSIRSLRLATLEVEPFFTLFDRIQSLQLSKTIVDPKILKLMPIQQLTLLEMGDSVIDLGDVATITDLSVRSYGKYKEVVLSLPPFLQYLRLQSCAVEFTKAPPTLKRVVFDDVDGGNSLITATLVQIEHLSWTKFTPSDNPDKLRIWRSIPPRPWSSHDFPIDEILGRFPAKSPAQELRLCGLCHFNNWAMFPVLTKLELMFPTFHPVPVLPETIESLKITKVIASGNLNFLPRNVRHLILVNCRLTPILEINHPRLQRVVIWSCGLTTVEKLGPVVREVDLSFNEITIVGCLAHCYSLHKLNFRFNELSQLELAAPVLDVVDISDNYIKEASYPGVTVVNNQQYRR